MTKNTPSMVQLFPSIGPPFFGRAAELFSVASDFMKRAGVKKGEKVIVLTDTRRDLDAVQAFFGAALAMGAEAQIVLGPPLDGLVDPPAWILDFLKKADLVFNMLSMEWGKQPGHGEVLKAGTRIAMVVETSTSLLKMAPSEKVLKRVDNLVRIIEKSKTIKITSKGGTDLTWTKSSAPVRYLNGLLDAERKIKWTNFPNSIVSFPFIPESGNGVLVVEPGDLLLHLREMVRSPVKITVKKSRITKIEGGYEADLLQRKWFDRWNDPDAYSLLHLSFGCDHRAELHPTVYAPMEAESYAGGILFGWGKVTHLDITAANTNVELDDVPIIKEGRLVHPDLV